MNSEDYRFFKLAEESSAPIKVTEDFYWYAIEILPPISANGWCGLGEAHNHTGQGEILTFWVCRRSENYYCFYGTKTQAEAVDKKFYLTVP